MPLVFLFIQLWFFSLPASRQNTADEIHQLTAALSLIDQGHRTEAIDQLKNLFQTSTDSWIKESAARTLMELHRSNERILEYLISHFPKDARKDDWHYELARIYFYQKRYQDSLQRFNSVSSGSLVLNYWKLFVLAHLKPSQEFGQALLEFSQKIPESLYHFFSEDLSALLETRKIYSQTHFKNWPADLKEEIFLCIFRNPKIKNKGSVIQRSEFIDIVNKPSLRLMLAKTFIKEANVHSALQVLLVDNFSEPTPKEMKNEISQLLASMLIHLPRNQMSFLNEKSLRGKIAEWIIHNRRLDILLKFTFHENSLEWLNLVESIYPCQEDAVLSILRASLITMKGGQLKDLHASEFFSQINTALHLESANHDLKELLHLFENASDIEFSDLQQTSFYHGLDFWRSLYFIAQKKMDGIKDQNLKNSVILFSRLYFSQLGTRIVLNIRKSSFLSSGEKQKITKLIQHFVVEPGQMKKGILL